MRTPLLALLLAACTSPVVVPSPGDTGAPVAPGADPGACDALTAAPEGDFLARGAVVSAWRPACTEAVHAAAGARDSTLQVHLDAWDGPGRAEVTVLDLLGQPLAGPQPLEPGQALPVALVQSGEVMVHVRPEAPTGAGNQYALSVTCSDGCDLEYTRYPIVLFHGAGPADAFGVTYFYGVKSALQDRGYLVVAPAVDPFASVEERGAQWADHLDALVAEGIGRRFDVIGHSQGGLDARYVVSRLGYADRVPAVITVGSPHRGSAVADLAAGILDPSPLGQSLVDGVANDVAGLLGLPPQDAMGAIQSLNTQAMAQFNADTPDAPGVYYASWAGHSCGVLEPVCIANEHGEIVNPLLGATYTLLELTDGANDGLVPVSSAKWGDFRGEIPADHLDEVGQIAETNNPSFDHLAFYLSEARRLASMGY